LNKVLFIPKNKFRIIPKIILLNKPLIMAIANCNSDSIENAFLKDKNETNETKYNKIISYIKDNKNNIDIIDIGGESTRPGSDIIEEKEEFNRISNLISKIRNDEELKDIVISIDTRKVKLINYEIKLKIF
jgi:dihydropteroate synthase